MREILFRGKGTIDGEWKYGYYAGEVCKTPFSPTTKQDNIIQLGSNLWCEVVPDTVGQFTGLTDKNGTKIFEGDIIQTYDPDEGYAVVRYDDTETEFYADFVGDNVYYGLGGTFRNDDIEVIGNIYDNPELIGGAEE